MIKKSKNVNLVCGFMHLCIVKAVRLRNVAKRNGGQEEAIGTLVAIAETCLFAKRSGVGGRLRMLTKSDDVKSFSLFTSVPTRGKG